MAKDFGNSQDLVSIKEIRDNTVITKNGGLHQIIMVGGINFALKSDTEQNIILQGYQNLLNSLDFPLQIIIHSRKVNIEKYLESLKRFEEKEPSLILRNQAEEYRAFISGFVEKNPIMEKSFFAVVPFYATNLPSATSVGSFIPFLKRKGDEEKIKREGLANLEENREQLEQRVKQVIENLSIIGLEAAVLKNEALIELFYNFYNPETVEKEKVMQVIKP